MNLTLKDIAKNLGISVATVSKALKDYKDVSSSTKKRVIDYTNNVGFKPNKQAAFLRTKRTKLIGLILPKINHDFFNNFLIGLLNKLEKTDYKLTLLCSDDSYEKERKYVMELIQLNVDAIFISIAKETNQFDHLKEIQKNKTTLILFDHYAKIIASNRVIVDNRKASFLATEHLIQKGCEKISCFRGELISQTSIDRFMGYKDALAHYGLQFKRELVLICSENTIEEGERQAMELLNKKIQIDGLVAVSDLIALGAMNYFKKIGIKIPEDIAVIGFGDWTMSSMVSPSLSSIKQNGFLMGKKVFDLFIKSQKNNAEEESYVTELIPTELIIRESTCR